MIQFIEGNLLESRAEALVNTVNTVGVMGKGIALQFKRISRKLQDLFPGLQGEDTRCRKSADYRGAHHDLGQTIDH